MRLTRVEVQGYKNASAPLCLEELGPINVIHGENNTGKSNLLEAIELLFELLGKPSKHTGMGQMVIPFPEPWEFDAARWTGETPEFPAHFIFNLKTTEPIRLSARFTVEEDEWRSSGMYGSMTDCRTIALSMSIKRVVDRIYAGIDAVAFDDEEWTSDTTGKSGSGPNLRHLLRFLTSNDKARPVEHRFAVIDAHRNIRPTLQPLNIALTLYDAKESLDPNHYRRWELFSRLMQRFDDVLGPGELVPVYDRHLGEAILAFQTARTRIPLDLLGTGVQQLVHVVALLLLSNATIVAIEEPELNLRYTLQQRLRELFEEIVASDAGPSQIFITSHSPAFETGPFFYHLETGADGPTITRRPVTDATMATAYTMDHLGPRGRAPLSYVTSDGLVQLPDAIRSRLGIERGGGIVVLKRTEHPYVELLTNQQFMDVMGPIEAEDGE